MSNTLGFSAGEKNQLPTNKKKLQEWPEVVLYSEIFTELAGELLGKWAVIKTGYS